jgi:hypothetical protein
MGSVAAIVVVPAVTTLTTVVSDVVSDEEGPGSDSWPAPEIHSDDDRTQGEIRIYIPPDLPPPPKPEWWTAAWEHLDGVQSVDGSYIRPVCLLVFKEECLLDVSAFDQPGAQTRVDSETGEAIVAGEGNESSFGVIGVIWSDKHVKMTRCGDKNTSTEFIMVCNFAQLVTLCPEGRTLTLQTHSKWLVEEWDMMHQWREHGYEGLQRSEVLDEWEQIMTKIERGNRRVQMCVGTGEEVAQFKEAPMTYLKEVVDHSFNGTAGLPPACSYPSRGVSDVAGGTLRGPPA